MKKTLLLGLVVILFMACQQVKPVRYTVNSPEIDIVKTLIKDYQDGNWDNWITHYADTAKVHHNSVESMSPQQLMEGFKVTLSNYSGYAFSDKDIFYEMVLDDKNDTWVYFWGTWEGTLKETAALTVIPIHVALKFVDAKIVEEYGYYNIPAIETVPTEKDADEAMPPIE